MQESSVPRHDLTVPRIHDVGWYFLLAVILGTGGTGLAGALLPPWLAASGVGIAIAVGLGLPLASRLVDLRLARRVAHDAESSPTIALDSLGRSSAHQATTFGTPRFAHAVVDFLWDQRGPGLVRICLEADEPEPWPSEFDYPFEPVSLRGKDPALRLMLGRPSGWREDLADSLALSQKNMGVSRRVAAAVFVVFLLLAVAWVAYFLLDVLQALIHQRVPQMLPALTAALGIPLLILCFASGTQWFLVPGGLMIRHGPRWRSNWRVALFKAAESQLVYVKTIDMLIVSDADGRVFARKAGRVEAEAALKAWLCAFPPPAPERLSEWGEVEAASAEGRSGYGA